MKRRWPACSNLLVYFVAGLILGENGVDDLLCQRPYLDVPMQSFQVGLKKIRRIDSELGYKVE